MIGPRLKRFRKKKGLSQKDLADIIGASQGYLSEVERGEKFLGGEFLFALKQKLDADINWLLSEDEGEVNGMGHYNTGDGNIQVGGGISSGASIHIGGKSHGAAAPQPEEADLAEIIQLIRDIGAPKPFLADLKQRLLAIKKAMYG